MAIGYGSVAMSAINSELGRYYASGISLDAAENGSYGCINQFSGPRPSSDNPAAMSEWRGYDHGYRPGASSYYGYDYYYTYCAGYVYVGVQRVIVDYIYNVPNDPCYGSYYAYYAYSYEYTVYYYYDYYVCGGGGYCLLYGTQITMADGTTKNVEDLQIGDIVLSADIAELPKEKGGYTTLDIVKNWSNPDISDFDYSTATVNAVEVLEADKFYSINGGLIEMSPDHIHLYKDVLDGLWKLGKPGELKVGDQFIDINKNIIDVESISIINSSVPVVKVDVENLDLFFANGILTHNFKNAD
jgi:hypothetical protein